MKNSNSDLNSNLRDIFDWRIMIIYRGVIGAKYVIDDFIGPFVPHVFDDYTDCNKKLLIVDQQSTGWIKLKEAVNRRLLFDDLTLITKKYNNGKDITGSAFWKFSHSVNSALNGDNHLKIAWTNLIKVVNIKGLPGNQRLFDRLILPVMPLLFDELYILKPDIVLFLTGSEYDDYIKLSVSVDTKLDFYKIQNYELNEFAGFEINGIPCYRLMRPSCMVGKNMFDKYLSDLIKRIK